MLRIHSMLAGLCALMLVPALTLGEEPQAKEAKKPAEEPVRVGLIQRVQHLLIPGTLVRMDLSAEQLDKQQQIESEWRSKRRAELLKMATTAAAAFQTIDGNANEQGEVADETEFDGVKFALAMCTGFLELRELRDTYRMKALAAFTPEQRKQYAALEWEQQRLLIERRDHRRDLRQEKRFGSSGAVLQPNGLDELKLSAEQQEKLKDLQKQVDAKLREILTPAQQQQLGIKDATQTSKAQDK